MTEPLEDVLYVAGWDTDREMPKYFIAFYRKGAWRRWVDETHEFSLCNRLPDVFLPLSLARHARGLLEAAKRVKAAQFASSTEPFEAMNELDAAIADCEGK